MFTKGQQVQVRTDLVTHQVYGGYDLLTQMHNALKKLPDGITTVYHVGKRSIQVEGGGGYYYSPEMFTAPILNDDQLFDAYIKGQISESEYTKRRERG